MPAERVEEIEPGIWRYSNGDIRYYGHPTKPNGAMAQRAGSMSGAPLVHERDDMSPADLAHRRHNLYGEFARGAVSPERWGNIVRIRADVAERDPTHVGNKAAEFVGQAIEAPGFEGRRQQAEEGVTLRITPKAIGELKELLPVLQSSLASRRQIVDAEARPVD